MASRPCISPRGHGKQGTSIKPLRFAALIRVSTEKQERKGESLRTQASQIDQAVATLGGTITQRYAGQEHATAVFEKRMLDTLLADAEKKTKSWDAIIVADAMRWSRDNVKSDTGLETLRDAGLRFFVLGTEYDLFNPEARLFLRMTATIGAYHAHNQNKKSMENRIARARRGIPTGGRLPFGRLFDKATGKWTLDAEKLAMIRDVAKRYLAGESLPKLARKYGLDHSGLCQVLRERCGDQWSIEFRANINETVALTVPRLLPDKTIRAVQQRLIANRTNQHKIAKYDYLLGGHVFCAECGYTMTGQAKPNGEQVFLYYRHAMHDRGRECPLDPRPWVRADKLEAAVLRDLFDLFGNPMAIERAVKAAVPDCDKALKQRRHIEDELMKIERARNRVLGLIEKDTITDAQAEAKLRELKERELGLRAELQKLAAILADVPDMEAVRVFVEKWADGTMDRQALIDSVFSIPLLDGKPAGVYLSPAGGFKHGPKQFRYELRGRLFPKWRVAPLVLA